MTVYKDCIVKQLRDHLHARGLPVSGLRNDLVRRLEEDDKKGNNSSNGGDVDSHGIATISENNARSRRTAKKAVALATLDIKPKHYCLEDSEQYSDCEMVQQLFELVWYSKDIRPWAFGTKLRGKENRCDYENKAERSYDLHLNRRAAKLKAHCKKTKMCDRSEREWEDLLTPRVFRSFTESDNEEGDTDSPARHCLACRRDFLPKPKLDSTEETQRSDIKFCESKDRHFNLDNCDQQRQLAYHNDDHEVTGKKGWQIPDTTFGLCTYDLEEKPWNEEEWLHNDMVKLFGKKSLKETMDHFSQLEEPYKISGTPVGLYSYPMFAFGLWEAKKDKGYSHENTMIQSSRKLKCLLKWHCNIFDKSEVRETSPAVWYFSSLGSDWRVYGCSETKAVDGDGFRYHLVQLWAGNLKDEENALQLLCIVDLIRFWVDYTYKPLIGTCISRLQAMKACKQPTPLNSTLWKKLRISIDREQTPWFFNQRRMSRSTDNLGVHPLGSYRGHSQSSQQTLHPENRRSSRKNHRSPTPAGEQFVMREKDDFNWLLDRDPGEEDLILIRVSETGKIEEPVIINSTSRLVDGKPVDWEDGSFNVVVEDERRSLHPNIGSIFNVDEDGNDYLWQCYRSKERWIHRGIQFSIILPVNVVSYCQKNQESQGAQLFEPLESLFRLQDLLCNIERARRKWCSCEQQRNRHWRSMVRCRNALCDISWFHKKCVKFSHSDDEASWLCDGCRKTPEKFAYIEMKPNESDDFAHASHDRLHLARSIENVWYKHDWPSQDEIIAKIDEIADKVDIIESAAYKIREVGVRRHPQLPRYWATSKDDPKNLILACSRKEGRVYHEAVPAEEDKKDSTNSEDDVKEETDYYTAEDDEDKLSRPKTTEARGRSKSFDADQTICLETETATGSEDDTLVGVEDFASRSETAKCGQSPALRLKHVLENQNSAKPQSLSG